MGRVREEAKFTGFVWKTEIILDYVHFGNRRFRFSSKTIFILDPLLYLKMIKQNLFLILFQRTTHIDNIIFIDNFLNPVDNNIKNDCIE